MSTLPADDASVTDPNCAVLTVPAIILVPLLNMMAPPHWKATLPPAPPAGMSRGTATALLSASMPAPTVQPILLDTLTVPPTSPLPFTLSLAPLGMLTGPLPALRLMAPPGPGLTPLGPSTAAPFASVELESPK